MIGHLIETHFIAKDADSFLSKSVAFSNLKHSTSYKMSAGHNPCINCLYYSSVSCYLWIHTSVAVWTQSFLSLFFL